MTQDGNRIIADAGKVLRRINSGEIFGRELSLGYSYYIGGVLQDPPHLDTPDDFEEIDDEEPITDTEALNIIIAQADE